MNNKNTSADDKIETSNSEDNTGDTEISKAQDIEEKLEPIQDDDNSQDETSEPDQSVDVDDEPETTDETDDVTDAVDTSQSNETEDTAETSDTNSTDEAANDSEEKDKPAPDDDDRSATQSASELDQKPKSNSNKKLIPVLILVILLIAAVAVYYFIIRKNSQPTNNHAATKVEPKPVAKTKKLDPQIAKLVHPKTGEKWLAQPQPVNNLNVFQPSYLKQMYVVKYFKVGDRAGNTIYLAQYSVGPGPDENLFEQSPDGKIRVILQPDPNTSTKSIDFAKENINNEFLPNITVDTTTHYDSLTLPSSMPLPDGQKLILANGDYGDMGDFVTNDKSGAKRQTVKAYGQSSLVKLTLPNVADGVSAVSYALDTPLGTERFYNYKPIPQKLAGYSWDNGVVVKTPKNRGDSYKATISPVSAGCSSVAAYGVSVLTDVSDSDFARAGTTPDGKTVYTFKDGNNPFVKLMYGEYTSMMKSNEGSSSDSASQQKILSASDYLKQHALVIYKDPSGNWIAYVRDSFVPGLGCGKPVVYLYPTNPRKVHVAVGAKITKSDPLYPADGWQVFARPSGQLTLNNKHYDSLFWEGLGSGLYPAVTSGTVVRRDKAATTMRSQLAEQGLKQHEINDFMDYWQSKIPNKPYVRLTWFNTAQMNQLAPLYISPKPRTVIRVFLDMHGYDHKINIPSQTLSSIPRHGFTVVEWGGLINQELH